MTKYELVSELKEKILSIPIEQIINLRLTEYGYGKYLCPFHNDHTPNNFKINRITNTYTCFACGEHGNAITFIMDYDNLSFPDAVIQIALELGLISQDSITTIVKNQIREYHQKHEICKEDISQKANAEILDKVYRIFMKGNSLIGKEKLSEIHLEKLKNERCLDLIDIDKTGYFTFPQTTIMRTFLKELMKEGLDVDILKTIPGFYYDIKKDSYTFSKLKNTTGIGIPILDVENRVVGIQIRTDDDGRYQWFSSSFTSNPRVKNCINGTSPGTPISVFYPQELKCCTIFITEGHFKAKKITQEFGAIAISVQGVNNWKDIPNAVNFLKSKYTYLNYIMIAFDADMARKESVLQPALKMGITLTNIEISKEMDSNLHNILHIGNKSEKRNASIYEKEAEEISEKLKNSKSDFTIYYCLWNEQFGKGIDDLLNAGNRFALRKMELRDFWNASYQYLKDIDLEKFKIKKETQQTYRQIEINDERKFEFFKKDVLSKI